MNASNNNDNNNNNEELMRRLDDDDDDSDETTTQHHQTHQTQRPCNPLENANIISQYLFWWAYPLLNIGSKRPLNESDLPSLLEVDTSSYNCNKIEQLLWVSSEKDEERNTANNNSQQDDNKKVRRSLGRVLCLDYFKSMWFAQLLLVISMIARIGQALALGLLIEQFVSEEEEESLSNKEIKKSRGYLWSGILVICGFIFFITKQRQFFITYRKG